MIRHSSKPRQIYAKSIETGEVVLYESIHSAARAGFMKNNIHRCLRGEMTKHRGMRWAYCDGEHSAEKAEAVFAALDADLARQREESRFPDVAVAPERDLTEVEKEKLAQESAACERLSKRLRYEDGKLIWTGSHHSNRNGKEIAGTLSNGYQKVRDPEYGAVLAHRLIFFMHKGWLPWIVDHRDGEKSNNRIDNLRAATNAQNTMNSKLSVRNKSGIKGVIWLAQWSKWQANIKVSGKSIVLGSYEKLDDAIAARKKGEEKYHGEFARK